MSSACESRDFKPTGNVPTVERNYPAVVLYTFFPSRRESSEIFVSEGDIVQLLYSVGGWVYVRTYEGKAGYIPLEFVGELESSRSLRSVFDEKRELFIKRRKCNLKRSQSDNLDTGNKKDSRRVRFNIDDTQCNQYSEDWTSINHGDRELLNRNPNACDAYTNLNKYLKRHHSFESVQGYSNIYSDENRFIYDLRSNGTRNVQRNLESCAVCSVFLARFIAGVQNLVITDRGKGDLKSRKLLSILQKLAQEGIGLIPSVKKLTNHNGSHCVPITEKCIGNLHDLSTDRIPVFSDNCDQCQIFKDFYKLSEKYSMTDLYATIRDLHINALSDSESDGETEQLQKDGDRCDNPRCADSNEIWAKRNNGNELYNLRSGGIVGHQCVDIKRSQSFQMEQPPYKNDIMRNNSFSGSSSLDVSNSSTVLKDTLPPDDIESDYSTPRNSASTSGRSSDTTVMSPTLNSRMPSIHSDEGYSSTDTGSTIQGGFHDRISDPTPCLIPTSPTDNNTCETVNDLICFDADINDSAQQNQQGTKPSGVYGFQSLITSSLPLSPRASPSKSPAYSNASKKGEVTKQPCAVQKSTGPMDFPPRLQTGMKPLPARSTFIKSQTERTKSFSDNPPKASQKSEHSPERPHQGSMHLQFSPPPIPGSECETSGHMTVPVIRGLQPKTDSDAGRRIIARGFQSYRNPMDIRGPNSPLSPDRDIRKTLHDLSNVKRTTSLKNTPMRAQHSIPIQGPIKEGSGITGRGVPAKKFNKQIWRPSQGMPEGSDQRPFSPFGGTLPPSKITKKKVVEVFV